MNLPRRKQTGFSLLELLVALFIVVLVTSMVSLSVNSGGRDVRIDATVRSLANIASYAMDEAQLNGVDYGLLLFQRQDKMGELQHGFAWRERRAEGWRVPRHDSEIFEEQLFDPDLELVLELEDYPLPEPELDFENDDERAEDNESAPQILLFASGETTPGNLELRRESNGEVLWRIEWDLLGRFRLLRHGEENEEDADEF